MFGELAWLKRLPKGRTLLGGKYKGIVDSLEPRGAKGTMFDYILVKGVEVGKP